MEHKHNIGLVIKVHTIVDWAKSHSKLFRSGLPVLIAGVVAIIGVTAIAFGHAATGPRLYLAPPSGQVTPDSEVSLTVHADSGSETVDTVQTALGYDQTQLQFVGFTEAGPFNTVLASDSSTPGLIRVARGIPTGAAAVSGDNVVVTLRFKVLAASGSPAISFDDSASLLVSSTTSQNILASTEGATLTVSSGTGTTSTGRLALAPVTANAQPGDTFTVTLNENSGSDFVSFVQANLSYDPSKLQFSGISEGNVFTTNAATDTTTAGLVRIGRGIPIGGGGVSGQNDVLSVSFKVLNASGTTSVSIDQNASLLVAATGGMNILNAVGSSTLTIAANTPPPSGSALLSLQPPSGSLTSGGTIAVSVNANGGAAALTTVEAVLAYPADQLQFVDTTDTSTFPTALRTNSSTPGRVDIIRSIAGGSQGVSGTNPVTVVNFKVIGTSGSAAVTFASGSGLYDDSGSGTNVLDLNNSQGANYTIGSAPASGCTGTPSTPGTPTASGLSYTAVSLSWTASTPADGCTVASYHVFRDGVTIGDASTTTFRDTGLAAGSSHIYGVQAVDSAGHTSAISPTVTVTTPADDQSPTTPVNVTAVANTSASVDLNWTASNDLPNPGGSGVAGYNIYRNGATSPTYTVRTGTSYSDVDVTAGTTYTYTVTAFDAAGNVSAPSNVVSVQTSPPACSGTPTSPTNLTIVSVNLTTASFSWTASTASDGCQLVGYKIFRGATLVGSATGTTFTDNGLTPNTIYAYTVKSYDSSAHTSLASDPLLVTTPADTVAPNAPTNVTAAAPSAGQVSLAWNAADDNVAVTGYRVYRDGTKIASLSASIRTYSDTALQANTDYRYEVSAVDGAGNESPKAAASPSPIHTPGSSDTSAPSVPSGLHTLAVTSETIAFGWTASSDDTGVLGYRVYRGGVLLGVTTTDNFADTGLTDGTQYSYTVKAFDAAGNLSQASTALVVSTLSANTGSLVGDLNGDGKVDVYDLSILLTNWEQQDVPATKGDLNQDNVVNFVDLVILLLNYGEGS